MSDYDYIPMTEEAVREHRAWVAIGLNKELAYQDDEALMRAHGSGWFVLNPEDAPTPEAVSTDEICSRLGRSRKEVNRFARWDLDFPLPIHRAERGQPLLRSWPEVRRWAVGKGMWNPDHEIPVPSVVEGIGRSL